MRATLPLGGLSVLDALFYGLELANANFTRAKSRAGSADLKFLPGQDRTFVRTRKKFPKDEKVLDDFA